ncbi:glycosyltransferase [Vibrio parahaemolyticus]|nr:glycosyltransferase [Vibrio parahaemolyticus]EGQ8722976.1 glycosyltransferase [Vibrio parahaemolyticus]EGQ8761428.1 glycosyltransferase [Vibrio parahaemolyticus]EGQ8792014.1 glycosyltransferase [Vibrio parahaemolyticus]EGQ8801787.1 glycosyltransferase [Vibrio parahaemolyticus]
MFNVNLVGNKPQKKQSQRTLRYLKLYSSYPRVSIITPAYNSSKYIYKTYESIKKQSFEDWEWIVVDDCSTDETTDIINGIIKDDDRVNLVINSTNSGAAASRNRGIDVAKGTYIAFIDSDDVWLPEKLDRQYKYMLNNQVEFSFTAYNVVNEDGSKVLCTVDTTAPDEITYKDHLKKRATLGCSTVMVSKEFVGTKRMPDIRSGQDYAFWLSLLKSDTNAFCLKEILTSYRITPGSISRNKIKKARRQWQIYRELEKLSLVYSIECFLNYAFRAIFRRS